MTVSETEADTQQNVILIKNNVKPIGRLKSKQLTDSEPNVNINWTYKWRKVDSRSTNV